VGCWRRRGAGIASVFDGSGVRVAVVGGKLDLRFLGVGYGGRLAAAGGVVPVAARGLARYRRGPVVEWYRNGPLGLEQGFTIGSRPKSRAGSAPLTVALGVGGSLGAQQSGAGVVFTTPRGAVALRYGGLSVLDASGHRLPAALALSAGRLLVRVWDRGARYPVRIDPFLQQGAKLTGLDAARGRRGCSPARARPGPSRRQPS
jgi:hypothetical protein